MGKKLTDFDDFDDDVVIDKKLKRKLARQAAREEQQQQQHSVQTEQDDTMSRVALLCQALATLSLLLVHVYDV